MSNTQNTKVKSTYQTLKGVSINDLVEKKGNQSYLSWASAWDLLKSKYPDAYRSVYESEHTGLVYFTDGKSAYVKVGITVLEKEIIDYLPIMDYRNNAIPLDKVTMVDVNKTIQRSTAKAIAMHGLGLSLWTGEDLIIESEKPKKKDKIELEVATGNWERVLAYVAAHKTKKLNDLVKELLQKYNLSVAAKKELSAYYKEINKTKK